ncbi:MAG: NADH-quinone oxidoreductase subunit K [Bdellovibrio sp.]|nr:NADH-quinone oxidoreductase subunit K [Bdellovibrio sp.]
MILLFLACFMFGIGTVCLIFRATLLNILMGFQILFFGISLLFAFLSSILNSQELSYLFGFFLLFVFVGLVAVGFSLIIRVYYLKKSIQVGELRNLKH